MFSTNKHEKGECCSILSHSDVPFYMYFLRVSGKYAKFITGIRHGSER